MNERDYFTSTAGRRGVWPFGMCIYPEHEKEYLRGYASGELSLPGPERARAMPAGVDLPPPAETEDEIARKLRNVATAALTAAYAENRRDEAHLLTTGTAERLAAIRCVDVLRGEVAAGDALVAALSPQDRHDMLPSDIRTVRVPADVL